MASSVGRTSVILASGTLVSRVLGFIKAIVLAQTIGLVGSASADAFANANSLPANIYALIAGGLLNAVLVPQIVRATKQADGGAKYVNRLITLAIVVLGVITTVLTIGAPIVAWIYGMTLAPEQLALVVAFAFWCLPQAFFYGLYAVVSEVLNARKVFAPFAWAPVLNNVIAIAGLIIFGVVFGFDPTGQDRRIADWDPVMIAVLGGMTTLGVVVQALILFVFLPKAGFRYRPDFHFRGTGLSKVGTLASWSLGTLVITQVAGWIETLGANVAFGQAASLAALQNAWMIFMLPHSIITVSLTTTMFTSMSERVASGDKSSVVPVFSQGARTISLFMVFSTVALMVISPAFARVFDSTEAGLEALAMLLCAALAGLLAFSLLFYVQRVFYAFEDTRAVFMLYLVTAPLQIIGIWLATQLLPVHLIVLGLVAVQSVVTLTRFAIQLLVLRRRLGRVDGHRILHATLRFALFAVPTTIAGALLCWMLGAYTSGGWARTGIAPALITCAVAGIAMAVIYFGLGAWMRTPELDTFLAPVLRRFERPHGRHSTIAHRHTAGTALSETFAETHGSLFDEAYEYETTIGSTTSVLPTVELATAATHRTTELPSRADVRRYEQERAAAKKRAAYEEQHRRDDETLL